MYRYPCTGITQTKGFAKFVELNVENAPPRHNLTRFASELEQQFGWPRVSLTNSGSSANLAAAFTLAEMSARASEGRLEPRTLARRDVVLCAGFTFPTTIASLLAAGFRVQLVDVARSEFCMSAESARDAIDEAERDGVHVAGLCVTHFLGFAADLPALSQLCSPRQRRFLMQDACETMSVRCADGRLAHEYGDVSTFSFYHPHHLSSFGGGAVSTPHESWRRVVQSSTHWGRLCSCHYEGADACTAPDGMHHNFHYVREGHNIEMSELNAAFGRWQLAEFWPDAERRRLEHYALLHDALADVAGVRVYERQQDSGSPFVFPISVDDPSRLPELRARLDERGVEIRSLMGGGIHAQPAYTHLQHDGLANTVDMSARSFFVGVHSTLETDDVRAVASILREELK
jgi:dTDP-4-amino-4,6-dideoxygalactose transaminase